MTAPSTMALELARKHVWTHKEADGRTVMHVCNGFGPMWSTTFEADAEEENVRANVEHRVDEVARLIQMGLDAAREDPHAQLVAAWPECPVLVVGIIRDGRTMWRAEMGCFGETNGTREDALQDLAAAVKEATESRVAAREAYGALASIRVPYFPDGPGNQWAPGYASEQPSEKEPG